MAWAYRTYRSCGQVRTEMLYPYPGYCGTVVQILQKFRAGTHKNVPLPRIVARSYRSYRSCGYGNECRAEVTEVLCTEVLCTGMNVVQNSQNFRVRVIPAGKTRPRGRNSIWTGGFHPTCIWYVLTGPASPRQSVAVWALSTTTTEAIYREPQRVATGATAALTVTRS